MDSFSLSIDFVSASAGTTSPTGEFLSYLWILGIVLIALIGILGICLYKKINSNPQSYFLKESNKAKNGKHVSSSYALNNTRFKIIGVLFAVILAVSAIVLFNAASALASPSGHALSFDVDKIIAAVQEDGSINFSTCNLKNISDKPVTLDTASVQVADEAKNVTAINSCELKINSFNGCVYQGIPNGQEHKVKDCSELDVGQSSPFALEIANLDKQSALELCGKHVFTINLKANVSSTVSVPVPADPGLTYNGDPQIAVAANSAYELTAKVVEGQKTPEIVDGNAIAIDAGTYTVTATLNPGYVWSDGTVDAKDITFTIAKADSAISFAPKQSSFTSEIGDLDVSQAIDGVLDSHGTVTYHVTAPDDDKFYIEVDEYGQTYLVCKGGTPAGIYNISVYATDEGDDNHNAGSTQSNPWTPTWKVALKTFTVDFDMNGHGTQVPSQTVAQGDKVSVPNPEPSEGNYEFNGWYTSDEFIDENYYDFNTPVTSNSTLHARWKGASKIILQTGEAYDGSLAGKGWVDNTDESGTVYKYFDLGTPFTYVLAEWNDSTTGKVTAITKTGYDFNEFKISENQQSQTEITDDQTLWYPQWTAQPCTITPDNTFTSTLPVEIPGGCVWNIIYGHKSRTGTWFPTTVTAQKDGEDKATFVGTDTDDRPYKTATYNGEEITSGDAISADGTLHLNIPDKQIPNPIAVAGLSYNGGAQIGVSHGEGYELSPSSDGGYLVPDIDSNGNATGADAGEYGVVASLKPGYIWDDGTNDPYSVVFTIDYAQAKVTANDTSKIFGNDDPTFSATVTGLKKAEDDINYSISRVMGDDAGEYPINVSGDEIQGNYKVTFVAGKFTIYRAPIARPTGITGLIYNGELQTGATGGTGYTLEPSGKPNSMSPQIDADGNANGINATETVDGYTKTEYGVKAILDNNHQWVDGDNPIESHLFSFEIAKADSTIEFAPGIAEFISLISVTPVKKEIKGATGSYGNITYVVTPTDYFEIVVDEDNQTYLVCKGGTPAGTYNITAYANDAGDDNHKPGSTQAFAWTPTWVVALQAHTVDFDMNGHGTQVPSQTIAQGGKVLKPATPTDGDYEFAGWYTTEEFTSSEPYDFNTPVTSSFTLHARWKGAAEIHFEDVEKYDGSLAGKGWVDIRSDWGVVYKYFDLGTPFTDVLAEWNNSSTGKVTAATKTGYDFVSFDIWEEQQTQTTITDDETLWYIQWTPQEYDINYYDQGGWAYTGNNEAELIKKHTYDTDTELIDGQKAGYSFDGWYTSSACTGNPVKGLGATDFTEGPINLYAKWTKIILKYKASVIKGEGEIFNDTELSGKGWKEDASGWYKEFNSDTPYSTILAEWGDASSWSTAKSISKPGMKLAGFTPDTGILTEDTDFSALWTPNT